ncbi:hypothetical protein TWF281_004383 [Arthrobotrys megalospora]
MKFTGIIALSAIALFNSNIVSAVPASDVANNVKLPSAPMFWIGTPTPGGQEVRLEGTAQEIFEQIKAINPNWEAPAPTKVTRDETPSVVKRYFKGRPTCDLVSGGWARNVPLHEEVIPYLERLGTTQCGARARTCSRVSCTQDSAVELCNDRTTEVRMDCGRIGAAAREIMVDCRKNGGPAWLTWIVKGQWFDTTGYNVVVRGASC